MAVPPGTIAPPPIKAAGPHPAMSDVAAPPVPTRSNPLRKPTHAEASSKLRSGMIILIFGLVVGGALLYFGFKVLGGAALLFFGGGGLLIVLGRKDEVSACPFCGAVLDTLPKPNSDNTPRPVQCKKCWEYAGVQKGFVSAYNPNAMEERPTFRAPVAQSVVWPHACVQCGAEPTRFDEVSASSLSAGFLVVGTVRLKTFKLSGVPYCDTHKKAVEMSTGAGNKLYLDWRSLGMMRRYLAANRGRFAE
jgi:hypothetical protein